MRTKSHIHFLRSTFNNGTKIKVSETKSGDTFIANWFGELNLYINTNYWKYDKEGKMTLAPHGVMSLHGSKQGFDMFGHEECVLVDVTVSVRLPDQVD